MPLKSTLSGGAGGWLAAGPQMGVAAEYASIASTHKLTSKSAPIGSVQTSTACAIAHGALAAAAIALATVRAMKAVS